MSYQTKYGGEHAWWITLYNIINTKTRLLTHTHTRTHKHACIHRLSGVNMIRGEIKRHILITLVSDDLENDESNKYYLYFKFFTWHNVHNLSVLQCTVCTYRVHYPLSEPVFDLFGVFIYLYILILRTYTDEYLEFLQKDLWKEVNKFYFLLVFRS